MSEEWQPWPYLERPPLDAREREVLEHEIQHHRVHIAELLRALLDIEENLKQVTDPPEELTREAGALRMALKGRKGAVELGAARLQAFIRAHNIAEA